MELNLTKKLKSELEKLVSENKKQVERIKKVEFGKEGQTEEIRKLECDLKQSEKLKN